MIISIVHPQQLDIFIELIVIIGQRARDVFLDQVWSGFAQLLDLSDVIKTQIRRIANA